LVLKRLLQDESEDELDDTAPLGTSRNLHPAGTVALAEQMEETLLITIEAHEAEEDSLGAIHLYGGGRNSPSQVQLSRHV